VIVIAGKNNIAVHALNKLVGCVGADRIVALPNENDLGVNTWQQSLRLAADNAGVKTARIEDVDGSKVELLISLEYDRIIKPSQFPIARLYNIHFSKLPKYKGMYTSIWPVLYGDEVSAVTLHEIDEGIDTGNVCAQKDFEVKGSDRARDIYRKYIENAISLFDEYIEGMLTGSLRSSAQSATKSSYFSKKSLDFKNLEINLNCTAWELQRQVYAYSFREYQLPKIFGESVVEVEITPKRSSVKPGCVIKRLDDYLIVSTVDYDAIVYFDKLDSVLKKLQACNVSELPYCLKRISGINDRNSKGWSPIIVAAYHGNYDVVKALLALGSDVNDINYNGTSVIMYAKEYALKHHDKRVFDLLKSNGARLEMKDFAGKALKDYITLDQSKFLGI
jgi:methionyl-tRNA formyltransferase